jgi:hypothetical protein
VGAVCGCYRDAEIAARVPVSDDIADLWLDTGGSAEGHPPNR